MRSCDGVVIVTGGKHKRASGGVLIEMSSSREFIVTVYVTVYVYIPHTLNVVPNIFYVQRNKVGGLFRVGYE